MHMKGSREGLGTTNINMPFPPSLQNETSEFCHICVTLSQSVELNSDGLVFVGDTLFVRAYVVITANSTSGSSTMCVPLQFHGGNVHYRTIHRSGYCIEKRLGLQKCHDAQCYIL